MKLFRSKEEKELDRLRNLKELRKLREEIGPEDEDVDPHPDGGENQVSPLNDDGTPFLQMRGTWDTEKEAFRIEMDWNAPGLQQIIAMGVEGETDFEVTAYGITLLAHQVIETEMTRRANETNQILEMREDDQL